MILTESCRQHPTPRQLCMSRAGTPVDEALEVAALTHGPSQTKSSHHRQLCPRSRQTFKGSETMNGQEACLDEALEQGCVPRLGHLLRTIPEQHLVQWQGQRTSQGTWQVSRARSKQGFSALANSTTACTVKARTAAQRLLAQRCHNLLPLGYCSHCMPEIWLNAKHQAKASAALTGRSRSAAAACCSSGLTSGASASLSPRHSACTHLHSKSAMKQYTAGGVGMRANTSRQALTSSAVSCMPAGLQAGLWPRQHLAATPAQLLLHRRFSQWRTGLPQHSRARQASAGQQHPPCQNGPTCIAARTPPPAGCPLYPSAPGLQQKAIDNNVLCCDWKGHRQSGYHGAPEQLPSGF